MISAQHSNDTAQESQQQFTGVRNNPAPQQPRKAAAVQPASAIQISTPPQDNRFGGSREAVKASAVPVTAAPVQAPQGTPQQFTGNRDSNVPSKVTTVREAPQRIAPANVNANSSQPVTAFGGNRQIPQQVQAVKVEPKASAAGTHFNGSRHMVVNTPVARQRPIVVHTPLPQTIIINQCSAVCPYVTLTPYAIAKKGNYIELTDGSVWKVRHRDRSKVKKWRSSDTIVIETANFFSWYAYNLVNYTRNESVDVELHLNDDRIGGTSHWIVEVNPYMGYVRLENGSVWRMSTSELVNWSQNDDVIIGLSKDWFSSRYDYILINPRAQGRFTATFEL